MDQCSVRLIYFVCVTGRLQSVWYIVWEKLDWGSSVDASERRSRTTHRVFNLTKITADIVEVFLSAGLVLAALHLSCFWFLRILENFLIKIYIFMHKYMCVCVCFALYDKVPLHNSILFFHTLCIMAQWQRVCLFAWTDSQQGAKQHECFHILADMKANNCNSSLLNVAMWLWQLYLTVQAIQM